MPCVFPVLSLKIIGIVENRGTKNLLPHGFGFLTGILLTMLALSSLLIAVKSTGAMIGWGFQLQSPFFVCALAALFIALSANLLGFFEFSFTPGVLEVGAAKNVPFSRELPHRGSCGFVASPCTAPFMGAALGYALSASYIETLFIFLALGLGMALPWSLLTVFPCLTRWLPKPGQWMNTLKSGWLLPMGLTALWLLWVLSQQISILAFSCIFCRLSLVLCCTLFLRKVSIWQAFRLNQLPLFLLPQHYFLVGGGLTLSAISPVPETHQRTDSWSPQR